MKVIALPTSLEAPTPWERFCVPDDTARDKMLRFRGLDAYAEHGLLRAVLAGSRVYRAPDGTPHPTGAVEILRDPVRVEGVPTSLGRAIAWALLGPWKVAHYAWYAPRGLAPERWADEAATWERPLAQVQRSLLVVRPRTTQEGPLEYLAQVASGPRPVDVPAAEMGAPLRDPEAVARGAYAWVLRGLEAQVGEASRRAREGAPGAWEPYTPLPWARGGMLGATLANCLQTVTMGVMRQRVGHGPDSRLLWGVVSHEGFRRLTELRWSDFDDLLRVRAAHQASQARVEEDLDAALEVLDKLGFPVDQERGCLRKRETVTVAGRELRLAGSVRVVDGAIEVQGWAGSSGAPQWHQVAAFTRSA